MKAGDIVETKLNGKLEVLFVKNGMASVKFVDTGYETIAQKSQVERGAVKDKLKPRVHGVGFIGDGEYTAKINGKICRAYNVWNNILDRCYDTKGLKKFRAYKDVTVCDEWHNFQNFADWFYKNYPSDGLDYDLDKDKLSSNEKIYSPETCVFISHNENTLIAKAKNYKIVSPDGFVFDVYNLKRFSIENGLSQAHMSSVVNGKRKSHKGWTKYEGQSDTQQG